MAIIACPDCGKDVSTMAAACPHCGYPLQEPSKVEPAAPPPAAPAPQVHIVERKRGPGCLGAIVATILVLWAIGAVSKCQRETTAPAEFKPAASANPASYTDADAAAWAKILVDESQPAALRLSRAKALIQYFPNSADAASAKERLGQLEIAAAKGEIGNPGAWSYSTGTDPMSSKTIRNATIESESPFELDFPYQGPQRASITLRKHPKWGKDVIFQISEGQLTCDVYECPIRVRFGDGQPVKYMAARAEDNSTEVAFIKQYDGFVSRMRKVDTIRVEFSVYRGGSIVQEFNVRGFDPKRME